MNIINIPRTGIQVSKLSFGTARLHHLATRRARLRLLSTAVDSGFTHFDSAPLYGHGLAEEELGRFIRQQGRSLTIATKVGLYAPGGAGSSVWSIWSRKSCGKVFPRLSRPTSDWTITAAQLSLDRSLRRMGRDYIDILFMHEPCQGLFNVDEWLDWFERQRNSGKIRSWGLAGPVKGMAPWLSGNHPLAAVLQVRDGMVSQEADALKDNQREMQFTYGYLSEQVVHQANESADQILRAALRRNTTGSIVVSTRKVDRIPTLARLAS